jgi:thiol-disulfide isomerase/thioredoxin
MHRMVAVALLVTACAGGPGADRTASTPAADTIASTSAPVTSTSPGSTTTPPGAITSSTDPRELAPDFSLDLGEGGTYQLSAAERPVYLVFWAEWCPVCRQELPIVDRISADYADRVDFVAPAWKSGRPATIEAAAELFPSGEMMWGLDPDEIIFELYGIPYQPVTVLIGADQTVVEAWAGVRPESEIRAALDRLVALPTAVP